MATTSNLEPVAFRDELLLSLSWCNFAFIIMTWIKYLNIVEKPTNICSLRKKSQLKFNLGDCKVFPVFGGNWRKYFQLTWTKWKGWLLNLIASKPAEPTDGFEEIFGDIWLSWLAIICRETKALRTRFFGGFLQPISPSDCKQPLTNIFS